jgi:hypothetical protein
LLHTYDIIHSDGAAVQGGEAVGHAIVDVFQAVVTAIVHATVHINHPSIHADV